MSPSMHALAFISMPGHMEWLVILVIMLLIFGKRLPELARSVGKSMTEFKKGINEAKESTYEVGDTYARKRPVCLYQQASKIRRENCRY